MHVCPDHSRRHVLGCVQQMMVITPIDADIYKTKNVTVEHRCEAKERFPTCVVWNSYFQHHNSDDNREHSVAKGFEPASGHLGMKLRFWRENNTPLIALAALLKCYRLRSQLFNVPIFSQII